MKDWRSKSRHTRRTWRYLKKRYKKICEYSLEGELANRVPTKKLAAFKSKIIEQAANNEQIAVLYKVGPLVIGEWIVDVDTQIDRLLGVCEKAGQRRVPQGIGRLNLNFKLKKGKTGEAEIVRTDNSFRELVAEKIAEKILNRFFN